MSSAERSLPNARSLLDRVFREEAGRLTATLVDRPLLEAKECIGGYAIIDVADLDTALEVARSFPTPDGKVEVRPVVER